MVSDKEGALEAKIKTATHKLMMRPDWAVNMEIVDELRQNPLFGRRVVKYIGKRLHKSEPIVGILAIQLLEAIVKNNANFHSYCADRDFMADLCKMASSTGKKKQGRFSLSRVPSDSAMDGQEGEKRDKILIFIQQMGKSFANSKSYPIFRQSYQNLLRDGVVFPEPLNDEISPVFTPPSQSQQQRQSASPVSGAGKVRRPKQLDISPPLTVAALVNIGASACVLFEMLNASDQTGEALLTDEVVQALLINLQTQHRNTVMANIQGGSCSELEMFESLRLNDAIVAAQALYDGLLNGTMQPQFEYIQPPSSSNANTNSDRHEQTPENKQPEGQTDLNDDFLGLSVSSSSSQPQQQEQSKPAEQPVSASLDAFPSPRQATAAVPVLAPPSSKPRGRSRGASVQHDLLGMDFAFGTGPAQQSNNGNSVPPLQRKESDFNPFGGSAPKVAMPEPPAEIAPQKKDSELDMDEFMALAMRHDQKPVDKTVTTDPFDPFA